MDANRRECALTDFSEPFRPAVENRKESKGLLMSPPHGRQFSTEFAAKKRKSHKNKREAF